MMAEWRGRDAGFWSDDFKFEDEEDISLECLALEDYIHKGQLDIAKKELDAFLVEQPMNPYVHLLLGKVCMLEARYDEAAWHILITMVYGKRSVYMDEGFPQRVLVEVFEPLYKITHTTMPPCVKGLMNHINGEREKALEAFRDSLVEAKTREAKIRALGFLALTCWELGSWEAAIGYCTKLLEFDPDNVLAYMWRMELEFLSGDKEASMKDFAVAKEKLAQNTTQRIERAKQQTVMHHVPPEDLDKGDLRQWILESRSPLLAPVRAYLVGSPGESSLWYYLRDELFRFDEIFGPSAATRDARMLADAVAKAVSENRRKEQIALGHPIRHPFGGPETPLVCGFVVQKILASSVRPALIQLVDERGELLWPRMLWKSGDDLRRDLIAMAFFTIFNIIWSKTLDAELHFEEVMTYQVLAMGGKTGFIEWIEGTVTQRKFDWQMGNPELWMPSFAASMTAAYCIGGEDRHSCNVLIREEDKRVFQIDFAYLFGQEPGGGLGAGPTLPVGSNEIYALNAQQKEYFETFCLYLYDVLCIYKHELAVLADRFTKTMDLEVPVGINVRRFMMKRLSSTSAYMRKIRIAQSDVGRLRKEYLAIAWGNRELLPSEFFAYLEKSKSVEDPELVSLSQRKESLGAASSIRSAMGAIGTDESASTSGSPSASQASSPRESTSEDRTPVSGTKKAKSLIVAKLLSLRHAVKKHWQATVNTRVAGQPPSQRVLKAAAGAALSDNRWSGRVPLTAMAESETPDSSSLD